MVHYLKYQLLSKYVPLPSSRLGFKLFTAIVYDLFRSVARLVRYNNSSYNDHFLDICLLCSFTMFIYLYLQVKTALAVITCDIFTGDHSKGWFFIISFIFTCFLFNKTSLHQRYLSLILWSLTSASF